MDGNAVADMGLSPADVAAITAGYTNVTAQFYARVLTSGKFVWDQFLNHDPYAPLNGDCPQPWVRKASCAADLRTLCGNATAQPQTRALLYGMSPGACADSARRTPAAHKRAPVSRTLTPARPPPPPPTPTRELHGHGPVAPDDGRRRHR